MSPTAAYYYDRSSHALILRDECGYREQAGRIADYQVQHTPESVLPFVSNRDDPDSYPDGCSLCGKPTWWESRWLPDGRWQERCSECHDTITTQS